VVGHLIISVDAPDVVGAVRAHREGRESTGHGRPRAPVPVQDREVGECPGVRRAEVEDGVEDAFVGPGDETVSLAEIVGYLREIGIATFKLPERLEVRDELPRNPLGKILKRELRDQLGGA
jgi:acyl-CoA synthetase (AMP-forming)/AMP-acid ligase II